MTAVFFDIDDTLLDYVPCCRQAFAYAMAQVDEQATDDRFRLFMDVSGRLFEEQKQGRYTVAQVMDLYPREFIARAGLGCDVWAFTMAFRQGYSLSHVLTPGAYDTLQALHTRYRLFTASNSHLHIQRRRLELAGVLHFFRDTYVSDDIGYDKPDRRFYAEALRRAGLPASEVLMVGDSVTTDVTAARAAGLHTCWYNPRGIVRPDVPTPHITDLRQLLSVL